MPANNWIRFLRNYGPIPTNDNMYDETIQRSLARLKIEPIELPAPHLEWLVANFRSVDCQSIILTGTAGDGKTYHCRRVWLELGGTVEDWNGGDKVQRLSLGTRQLIVVKDLSELRSDESKPLIEQMAWDVADPNSPRVYLMAANHGQLLEKLKSAGSDKHLSALVEVVENLLVVGRSGNAAIRLDLRDLSRSAAAPMIDRVIDAVTSHPGWEGCLDCPALGDAVCPIRENRARLVGSSDNGLFRRRLGDLVEASEQNGGHFTIRQVLSLSTAQRPIVAAYEAAGFRVIGAATAWKIASALGKDLGIESRATADWLALLEHGKTAFDDKTVLIIDEAGLIGARDMLRLLEVVKTSGSKLVLVGDRNQIQPIAAGPGLGLVARSVEVSRIETIIRQREAWLRQVVLDLGKGDALRALTELLRRKHVHFGTGLPDAVEALVGKWRELTDAGETPLLIARTNDQLRMISQGVRRDRRMEGEIGEAEITFSGRLPNGEIATVALSPGDGIRFLAKNKALGTINGSVGTVIDVAQGPTLLETRITALVDDRRVTFALADVADENGNAQIGWDYGWSAFGSQGVTVEHALVLADANFDRHLAYVSASRARARTHLFVDGASIDAIETDISSLGPLSEEAERLVKLSRRMARKNAKRPTLDHLPQSVWDRWRSAPVADANPSRDAHFDRFVATEFDHV